jgi:hypothetical protein
MTELEDALPAQLPSSADFTFDEKPDYVDTPSDEKGAALVLGKSYDYEGANEKSLNVNGEPVITSGIDVSKYLVDLRDDGDPPFTFRSVVLGTVIGGLGAALYQVCCTVRDDLDAGH